MDKFNVKLIVTCFVTFIIYLLFIIISGILFLSAIFCANNDECPYGITILLYSIGMFFLLIILSPLFLIPILSYMIISLMNGVINQNN